MLRVPLPGVKFPHFLRVLASTERAWFCRADLNLKCVRTQALQPDGANAGGDNWDLPPAGRQRVVERLLFQQDHGEERNRQRCGDGEKHGLKGRH